MEKEELISVDECSIQYNIEYGFINSLDESGLIELVAMEEKKFIHAHQLPDLETFIRLHYELEINMEGLEAIAHLLQRVKRMRQELAYLRKRLHVYETLEEGNGEV